MIENRLKTRFAGLLGGVSLYELLIAGVAMIYRDLVDSIKESLVVPDTHIVLLGPSGCGKTHLLNDILPRSGIIDRMNDAMTAATCPIDAKAMDHWVVRTNAAFGFDEPGAISDSLAALF